MNGFQNPNTSWFNEKSLLESRTLGCTRNSVSISTESLSKYFPVPNWQCNCVSLVFPLRELKFVASPNTTFLYPPPLNKLEKQTENYNQLKPSQGRGLGCFIRVQTIAVNIHVAGIFSLLAVHSDWGRKYHALPSESKIWSQKKKMSPSSVTRYFARWLWTSHLISLSFKFPRQEIEKILPVPWAIIRIKWGIFFLALNSNLTNLTLSVEGHIQRRQRTPGVELDNEIRPSSSTQLCDTNV